MNPWSGLPPAWSAVVLALLYNVELTAFGFRPFFSPFLKDRLADLFGCSAF
jgi:hypothetical protein